MSLEDLQNEQPFSYETHKNGSVHIAYLGKTVSTLKGKNASRFLSKIESCDDSSAQLLMAKATGNFKRGNERGNKPG